MKQLLAYFLTALILLQLFGRELLVVSYELNKARITARYCVNKARPQLRCHGRCHLSRQLRKTETDSKKAPAGAVAQLKFEVLPAAARLTLEAPRHWPAAVRRYPALPPGRPADAPVPGVFRPPLV